jgi:hypothetical protein
MALSTATFQTNEVTLFLSQRYPYATTCFAQDMLKHGDTVKSTIVEKWFRSYFPAESAFKLFRILEATVTQTIHIKN